MKCIECYLKNTKKILVLSRQTYTNYICDFNLFPISKAIYIFLIQQDSLLVESLFVFHYPFMIVLSSLAHWHKRMSSNNPTGSGCFNASRFRDRNTLLSYDAAVQCMLVYRAAKRCSYMAHKNGQNDHKCLSCGLVVLATLSFCKTIAVYIGLHSANFTC